MVAILAKVIFMEAPLLEASLPGGRPRVAALVSRMLAKDPQARPRDGVALLAELEGFTGFEELAAAEPRPQPLTPRCLSAAHPGRAAHGLGRADR